VGETVGLIFAASFGFTGSARRTSGSDGLANGTGIGEGLLTATEASGVGATVNCGAGLFEFSNGNA
jgi:hypothetical protein